MTSTSGETRAISPLEIRYVTGDPVSQTGGLRALDANQKLLFRADPLWKGFDELRAYLQQKAPHIQTI